MVCLTNVLQKNYYDDFKTHTYRNMSFSFGDNLQDAAAKKEEAKINRMRQMQEERRDRIFNTKERTIGINIKALDQQAEQNKHQKVMEKEKLRLESKYT